MNLAAELIKAYSEEPIGQGVLDNFDIAMEQGNSICGDTITVYLKIEEDNGKNIITGFSHDGNPQMFTLAAASMLAETIEGKTIDEVSTRGGEYMKELGLDVSPRRKRSTVSALLAVHNALYTFLGVEKREDYEDILEY